MKPRKVVIVIEVKSDWSLKRIRDYYKCSVCDTALYKGDDITPHQVSVQVVKEKR